MVSRWIKMVLALAVAALLLGGVAFYRDQEELMQRRVAEDLTAIARLKVNQIAAWRKDQLDDAVAIRALLLHNHGAAALWADPAAQPDHKLRTLLLSLALQHDFSNILLVDPDGRPRFSLTGYRDSHLLDPAVLEQTARTCTPFFLDLHVCAENPLPHISVIAPICAEDDPNPQLLGTVILMTDAWQFLYPLIQDWPTPSATAETLLVRRDGDEVLFLNDLRHQPGAALNLRLPITRTDVPAVMAVLGRVGFVRGRDYRGVEVAVVILPVPDSPWFMIAKIDEREAFAEWRFRSALLAALIVGLSGLIGVFGLVLRQHEKKNQYRALFQAEAALRGLAERQAITLKAIGDAVIATDARGRVELMNPVAEALTGWSETEALGRPLAEVFRVVNEDTLESVEDPVARVLRDGVVVGLANHSLLIARDGGRRPIADSGAPIRDERGEIIGVVLVFRDQSSERLAEQLIRTRLGLIDYAAGHSADQVMQRALDEIGAIVESPIGFFHFVEADGKTLSLQQWSTRTRQEFCRAEARERHYPIDQAGVWADCVRERRPVVHNDYASLPNKKGMPEGHARLVRELVVPVMRQGQVLAVLGVGNKPVDYTEKDVETVNFLADVTWEIGNRRRAQEARRDSEKRYRRLFEAAGDGIVMVDAVAGQVLEVNPALLELLGCDREALVGRALWDIASFKSIAASADAFSALMEQRVIHRHQLTLATAAGAAIEVELVGTIYPVDHHRVLQCNVRDLSERKQAERERERLLAALEQAGEMILITDPEGNIEYVNPAFERTTGYLLSEVCGRNPRLLQSGEQDPAFYQDMWATISAGGIWTGRLVNRRKDGAQFTEQATISPVVDATGRVLNYVAVKRDITEHLKLEAQYRQAQKMESVARLAGGVAHDYNNMLTVIIGYSEMAMAKVAADEGLQGDLKQILGAARRSADITRQLLAFARKQTISPEVLDLNAAVNGVLKMLRRLIGEDLDLSWQPARQLEPIKIDPAQIDQILANLCVNARDAIAGVGKISIETAQVTLDAAYCAEHAGCVPGDYALLSVSDNGSGMDRESLERIFEPFFTTKAAGRGTGLGLATVYGIVKQNNGFISVYSEPGQGSTFKIYLPTQVTSEAAGVRAETPVEMPLGRGETILVVEDEPLIRELAEEMLTRLGYGVLVAGSPDEALQRLSEPARRIDLLMTDVVMPGMNGRDLAERLRRDLPDLKTLFMSGYTADVIARRGVLDQGVHFVQKPFTLRDLAVKVHAALTED